MAKARYKDREIAIKMRLAGESYSIIKSKLGVSKSSLSFWLRDYPLAPERLREIRDRSPRRIESFRNTMRLKREARLNIIYQKVKNDLSFINDKILLLAGFFLYWAEGTKTNNGTVSFANTDPSMIKFFISWMNMLGVRTSDLKVRLHLYSDMSVRKYVTYWSKELGIPLQNFKKPYIKKSRLEDIMYKGGHGHGTCNVQLGNKPLYDYILMGIKCLRENQVIFDKILKNSKLHTARP